MNLSPQYLLHINVLLICMLALGNAHAQVDTNLIEKNDEALDSLSVTGIEVDSTRAKPNYRNPKKAALFSALAPGLGQIYNRKYWKLPIVYGALGTATFFFFDNRYYYIEYRTAYLNDLKKDEVGFVPSSYFLQGITTDQLRSAADESRKNMEYSVIAFAGIYALQIIDAVVDAHLFSFDVSDDISMQWQPVVSPQTNKEIFRGISMNFTF